MPRTLARTLPCLVAAATLALSPLSALACTRVVYLGANDDVTGQAIMAYVTVKGGVDGTPALGEELRQHVAKKIGPTARPKTVIFTDELPKTRSGKIMRRLLRDVAEKREVGDVTTLADSTVMDLIGKGLAASTED